LEMLERLHIPRDKFELAMCVGKLDPFKFDQYTTEKHLTKV
jgi:hypothetical protein